MSIRLNRRVVLVASLSAGLASSFGVGKAPAQTDPLPSWRDTPAKKSIMDFIAKVTTPGTADHVPAEQRIATFDNDGTLWTEKPFYFQLAFALDRLKLLAPSHPEWESQQPYAAALAGDPVALAASGDHGLLKIIAATHAGMTTDEFADAVSALIATAEHPRFKRPYTDLVFQPMLELLAYLRQNGFKTFVVSGGGIEFMRAWAEKAYGIPPEQVIGSSGVTEYKLLPNGEPVLEKIDKVEFIDDGPGKPVGINRFVGRRPILAFGNSDGDQQMLEWTAAGTGQRFMGLVHHTDGTREYAYDRSSPVGKLDKAWDEALRKNWTMVDMKNDWKVIFPFEFSQAGTP